MVRETKDYGLRAEYAILDEIGRVTAAFNDMLTELAAARERDSAERAEFARVTRVTTMGEMAASIAHEVNQPLAAIVASGNAGLRWLANETPDLGKVNTLLQRIVRDGLRASEVVGSVRAMFKKDVREKSPIDVRDFISEALVPLHGELQSEQISVEVEAGKGVPSVLADRVQLQQVFVNLITNAIDAMRSVRGRSHRLRIGVRVVESDGVLITVADTGLGIDPDVRDRMFEPFFTTKPGGMGLGLSICRSIIEAHGGRVWAAPGTPYGTSVQLMLPASDASAG
jgi:signal transduction histidine kinase